MSVLRSRKARHAKPSRLAPLIAGAGLTTALVVADGALLAGTAAAVAEPSVANFELLAQCESGGRWNLNTGNGYYGGLQFSLATWRWIGFTGYPHQHSKETQIRAGQVLQARSGWGQWPACAQKLNFHGSGGVTSTVVTATAIQTRYQQLGGSSGFLADQVTGELRTPDGTGAYTHYRGGSIYWSPPTGAREVHGAIRAKWAQLGWERSVLAYPVTDERRTPVKPGAFSHFQGGSVYWSPATGAWEVHGAIRAKWAALGWENSRLGFPISDEYPIAGGQRSNFQYGYITWTPTGGAVVH